jgi:hypothetical protein
MSTSFVRDHRADADHDAEHREERAQLVDTQRVDGDADRFGQEHRRGLSRYLHGQILCPTTQCLLINAPVPTAIAASAVFRRANDESMILSKSLL